MGIFSKLSDPPPLIGQPTVYEWRPVVTFACSCGKGKPMLITAVDQEAVCSGCGDSYILGQLLFDYHNGLGAGVAFRRKRKKVDA